MFRHTWPGKNESAAISPLSVLYSYCWSRNACVTLPSAFHGLTRLGSSPVSCPASSLYSSPITSASPETMLRASLDMSDPRPATIRSRSPAEGASKT
mmetsp:Transcript_10957/g.25494  ORF Transcript_10957/g.25494 Transcript_10957/m.25494 type:complete len:97 (-) Transcript_10957:26-316(-)